MIHIFHAGLCDISETEHFNGFKIFVAIWLHSDEIPLEFREMYVDKWSNCMNLAGFCENMNFVCFC